MNYDEFTQASLPEVLVDIDCGGMKELSCLCDPHVASIIELFLRRFNTRERAAILKKLCGCQVVQQTTPTAGQPMPTVPVSFPVPPTVPTTPTPVPEVPPPPTVAACPEGLPPPRSFTV